MYSNLKQYNICCRIFDEKTKIIQFFGCFSRLFAFTLFFTLYDIKHLMDIHVYFQKTF